MTNDIKEKIALEVIRTLVSRFELFPEDATNNRNAPFHEAFLNAFADKLSGKVLDIPFFISLSSWLHGLNTTLGQSFFESVAHILSKGEKREYTSKKLGNLKITSIQKKNINNIVTELSTGNRTPSLNKENKLLFIPHDIHDETEDAIDFSADVFFEDHNKIVSIELKTVKPNSGEMRGEKRKILEGKAALFNIYRDKKILFYIGFPFDPTSEEPTSFNKDRFLNSIINMTKYFDPQETLIASELWDYLSQESKTMENILKIINDIATTDFQEEFKYLNDTSKRDSERYTEILKRWHLYSELELLSKDHIIRKNAQSNLIRIYNQKPFKNKGHYNLDRYLKLKELCT